MKTITEGQRVHVKQDEDDKPVNRTGTVTRVCTDGQRAWIQLDAKGGGEGDDKVRAYAADCKLVTEGRDANRAERRENARVAAEPQPELANFGHDHWSTFAYIETRITDHSGEVNRDHMRCHANRHPLLVGRGGDGAAHPTRLKGDALLTNHDDWDCAADLEEAGLLTNVGSAVNPIYRLTDTGRIVAGKLRHHKGLDKSFSEFVP